MSTELALYQPQIVGNELEEYADRVANKVFVPLAEFDVFWLNLIKDNPEYWGAEAARIMEKWAAPPQE